MDKRILLAVGAIAAAVVLFFVLRPDGGDSEAPLTTNVAIEVRGGRPVGGVKHVHVDQGDHVVVSVTSDVADEVHVHGYDLVRDVGAGKPARIAFEARLAGGFEVELEERDLLLAKLEVSP